VGITERERNCRSSGQATPNKAFRFFESAFRDQEVDGSNPFPGPLSKPTFSLVYATDSASVILWTNVYQIEAQTDAFRPFLTKRHVVFEF